MTFQQYQAQARIEAHSTNAERDQFMNDNYPLEGYKWSCGEQILRGSEDGSARGFLTRHRNEPEIPWADVPHYIGLRNHAYASTPVYVNWGGVYWSTGESTAVINLCRPYNSATNTYAILPGDVL